MRTIAITLCDNDFGNTFGNTFRPLLETVYRAIEFRGERSAAEEEAAIRAGIEFHYMAFQYNFGRGGQGDPKKTVEYLNTIKVLFDEEAEEVISKVDHDSGSWYLELATGRVYAF